MPDASTTLTRLVTEFAARDRPDRDPDDLPLVVLWGARGSESSALLSHLRTLHPWDAPRAHLDGEQLNEELRPHEVANRLAFQLGQKAERFGRARFPRFFLGMLAVTQPLDPDSAPAARDARKDLIDRRLNNRPEGRQWLRDSAQAIARGAGLGDQWTDALGLAVDGAIKIARTIALLRGDGLQWYRHGLGRHVADPVDALVELAVAEYLGNAALVDDVLCRAFVADLRGEFESGAGRLFVRRTSALVLLDNVGRKPTREFVELLAGQPGTSGPLLVVAASHLRFPDEAADDPVVWQPDALAAAAPQRWSGQRAGRGGSRYYPVWVDPVDDVPATAEPLGSEVQEIAHRRNLRPAQFPVIAFARRLTAAHPAGLDMVLDTLGRNGGVPGHVGDSAAPDLRGVFGMEHAGGERLDDAVFDLVLGSRAENLRPALALAGIAVDLSDTRVDAVLAAVKKVRDRGASTGVAALPDDTADEITAFEARDLWVAHEVLDGRAEPPRMHPFARRAIAHRLGREDGVAGLRWHAAHTLLRDEATARQDAVARLYHDLALGRIGTVAEELTELFDPKDPREWYRLLTQVTKAPLEQPARAEDTNALFGELCAAIAHDTLVPGALITAMQLHTDPLSDPFHVMCAIVRSQLGLLSERTVTGKAFLLEQSREFDDCSRRWHRR